MGHGKSAGISRASPALFEAAFLATPRTRALRSPPGAGGRLQAAYAVAIQKNAARLIPTLIQANVTTYLHRMQQFAQFCDVDPPRAVTDAAVLARLTERARISARSIATTQARQLARFLAEHASRALAEAHFATWHADQKRLIAEYETASTIALAQRDFAQRNRLHGTERAVPNFGVCKECRAAVAAGEVPLNTLPDFPLHIGCQHSLLYRLDIPTNREALWFGGMR